MVRNWFVHSPFRCLTVQSSELHSRKYESDVIKLPVCYSQPNLPADLKEVPTPTRIGQWRHLTGLKSLNIKNTDCPVQCAIGPVTECKDMADGELLRRAYVVEFCEGDSDKHGLSIEDGHFLKVMREQVTMVVTITYPPFPTRC